MCEPMCGSDQKKTLIRKQKSTFKIFLLKIPGSTKQGKVSFAFLSVSLSFAAVLGRQEMNERAFERRSVSGERDKQEGDQKPSKEF